MDNIANFIKSAKLNPFDNLHTASKILTIMAVLYFFFTMEHYNISAQVPQVPTIYIRSGASNPGIQTPFDPPVANFGLTGGAITVTWINEDTVLHTVTSLTNSFDSQMIAPGNSFVHTFYDSGYYDYYCTLHPYMTGAVNIS